MSELPRGEVSTGLRDAFGGTQFLVPPIPNILFQRDPSCWIYGGVVCDPMYWPARKPETLLQRAVYKFHPTFKGGDFKIWWGDADEDFTGASMEGGDVMPIGNGVVLVGMGERTSHQAVTQVCQALFRNKAATRVVACLIPKSRGAMHLDTVFTFCDRDVVTIFRESRRSDQLLQRLPDRRQRCVRSPQGYSAAARHCSRRAGAERITRRGNRRRLLRGRA